jgi:hypothetical protein
MARDGIPRALTLIGKSAQVAPTQAAGGDLPIATGHIQLSAFARRP